MVEAVFLKKYPFRYLLPVSGLFLMGLFIFISIRDGESSFLNVLPGVIFGAITFSFGVFSMFLNYKAYLYVADGRVKGKYHWFGKIDCSLSEVGYAMAQFNTLTIQLNSGKVHAIAGVLNSWELCAVLRANMPFDTTQSPEKLIDELNRLKIERKKGFIHFGVLMALLFVNIFIAMFLTGFREMSEFSKTDWVFMAVMGVVEVVTFIALLLFAVKVGGYNVPMEKLQYSIRRVLVENKPSLHGFVVGIYTDLDYSCRITLFGYPHKSDVFYSVQNFDGDYNLLREYNSDIYEDKEYLPNEFCELIDITEKVLK